MAVVATYLKRQGRGDLEAVVGLVFSGTYPTGGETVDFAAVVGYTTRQPTVVPTSGQFGYTYNYDLANKKMKIFTTADTEVAAGAYPANVAADIVRAVPHWFTIPQLP